MIKCFESMKLLDFGFNLMNNFIILNNSICNSESESYG